MSLKEQWRRCGFAVERQGNHFLTKDQLRWARLDLSMIAVVKQCKSDNHNNISGDVTMTTMEGAFEEAEDYVHEVDLARLQFELEVTFHLCLGCHKATEPNPSRPGPLASEVPACNEMRQVVAGGPVVDAAPCSACRDQIRMDKATAAQREAKLKAKKQKEEAKQQKQAALKAAQQEREAKQAAEDKQQALAKALVKEAAAQRFKAELEQIKQLQLAIMQKQPTKKQ